MCRYRANSPISSFTMLKTAAKSVARVARIRNIVIFHAKMSELFFQIGKVSKSFLSLRGTELDSIRVFGSVLRGSKRTVFGLLVPQ